jgi:hypothetical protein
MLQLAAIASAARSFHDNHRKSVILGERPMSGPRILASTALALILAAPLGAFAQDSNKLAATFDERYPAEQTPAPIPPATATANIEQNVTPTARVASVNRPRSRVVVVPRSFLDAGTEVLPGQRKFLDYAFPPTHTPMDVVTNTGGRVGWHNSPLPGPFFPWW